MCKATLDNTVYITEGVLFQEVDGEAVILDMNKGIYFGLDEVGTQIWQHLQSSNQVQDAYNALLDDYDVSNNELRQELLTFIDQLVAHNLLYIDIPIHGKG